MESKRVKFLKSQVAKKIALLRRVERLDSKETELFIKHEAVRRFVAIQHLRESYKHQLQDLTYSLEAVAENLVKFGEV